MRACGGCGSMVEGEPERNLNGSKHRCIWLEEKFMSDFKTHYDHVSDFVHKTNVRNGFWGDDVSAANVGEKLALIHAEVSEALEAVRKKNMVRSDKIPDFFEIEEELADVIIRIMDLGRGFNWDVAGAVDAKATYNATREYKHGKKF
jgi:NTP pyrophosphatase (non-canonical NTP hydrolase)